MDQRLIARLEEEMQRLYDDAKEQCEYNATCYLRMLRELGAEETAIRLAGQPGHHEGLTKLWEKDHLDLSVERLMLREPWITEFPLGIIAASRRKLKDLEYSDPGLVL